MSIDDFAEGQIIKMAPGYHTTKPYYVLVKSVDSEAVTTTIPGGHDLRIALYSYEWECHIPRMTIIGDFSEYWHLLLNQEFERPISSLSLLELFDMISVLKKR